MTGVLTVGKIFERPLIPSSQVLKEIKSYKNGKTFNNIFYDVFADDTEELFFDGTNKRYRLHNKIVIQFRGEDKNLLKMTIPKNIVFSPNEKDIFSYMPFKDYELPRLANDLCGKHRPGHFNGVINIVNILFKLVQPKFAIFGKKDYQQLILIKQFSEQNFPQTNIIGEETMRASNFLALSSRNSLLNEKNKIKANELFFALKSLIEMVKLNNNFKEGEENISSSLANSGWDVEYISIRRQEDLLCPTSKDFKLVALAAAKLNNVRLIDNIEFCID